MNFKPEMVVAIFEKGKIETRRLVDFENPRSHYWQGGCFFQDEKDYAICPGRGKPSLGRLRLTFHPIRSTIAQINNLGAQREGFRDRADFLDYFDRMHPKAKRSTPVWVIRFLPIERDDRAYAAMRRKAGV